jgi:hypothetical protein
MHSVPLTRLLLGHPHLVLVRKSVAPGRSHCVFSFTRRLAKRLATYASSPIKPKGRSDKELAGAPGVRISPLAGYGPLNRNCCCYCGGGLGSGVRRRPHNREESRGRLSGAATRRAASLRASQPSRRVGQKGPPIWYIWIFRTARRRGKRHAGPRRDVGRAQKVARAVTAPRAQ